MVYVKDSKYLNVFVMGRVLRDLRVLFYIIFLLISGGGIFIINIFVFIMVFILR